MIAIRFTAESEEFSSDIAEIKLVLKKESETILLASGRKQITIGVGEKKELSRRKLILAIRQIIAQAKSKRIQKLAVCFEDFLMFRDVVPEGQPLDAVCVAELMGTNIEMANFEFVKYKTPPKEGWNFVEEMIVVGKTSARVRKAIERGQVIGEEVNRCRMLTNTPGGEMTPRILAEEARRAVRNFSIKVQILGKKEMEQLGMGAVLGVGRGSSEEPKFIILEYLPFKKTKPIVLIGKGVTFDTGGLNLKTSDSISEMHMDMSGGSAVIHTIVLAARLGIKKNIVGLIPAVENMPSGSSYHPGDILRTMSGKTIEVLNTDAEGRVILADALCYAAKYTPRLVVDVATLTGAAMVALGQRASAIFTKDEKLETFCRHLGEESGDYVWPLPLWDEYAEEIKGTFGDVANVQKTRYGGAISGAMFLYQFVNNFAWLHIDIAPRMTTIDGEYLAKGAAGAPIRLLVKLLEKY